VIGGMVMEPCSRYGEIDARLLSLEQDIKDLKTEQREDRALLNQTIVTMTQNITRLTVLTEKAEERAERQEKQMEEQDKKLDSISDEIHSLKQTFNTTNSGESGWRAWASTVLDSQAGKVIVLVIFGIILSWFGYDLGILKPFLSAPTEK
jgi:prophage DNA circulation protein